MPDLRVAGQDTNYLITSGNAVLDVLRNVRSTSITFEFERKEEEFLSEFSARYDEFFKGVTGNLEAQVNSPEQFDLLMMVKDRAQRRGPAVSISLKTTITFPKTGFRKRFILSNLAFGSFPVRVPGRTEYVTIGLDFGTGEAEII